MPADAQFQMTTQHPANLDRCRRCGAPRMLHGNDGGCALSFSLGSRPRRVFVTLGGGLAVLVGAAWMLATSPAIDAASMLAYACLVILVVGGAALALSRSS